MSSLTNNRARSSEFPINVHTSPENNPNAPRQSASVVTPGFRLQPRGLFFKSSSRNRRKRSLNDSSSSPSLLQNERSDECRIVYKSCMGNTSTAPNIRPETAPASLSLQNLSLSPPAMGTYNQQQFQSEQPKRPSSNNVCNLQGNLNGTNEALETVPSIRPQNLKHATTSLRSSSTCPFQFLSYDGTQENVGTLTDSDDDDDLFVLTTPDVLVEEKTQKSNRNVKQSTNSKSLFG